MVPQVTGKRVWAIVAAMAFALSTHGAARPLERVIDAVLQRGLDSQLPAHLSVVLGVSRLEQQTAVKQAVIRDGSTVRTFNVSVANHGDVVMLLYDEQSHSTKAFLVSAAGFLRRAVSYQAGGVAKERSLAQARSDFAREINFWTDFQEHPGALK